VVVSSEGIVPVLTVQCDIATQITARNGFVETEQTQTHYLQLITLNQSIKMSTLCLKKGTPTLSTVTLERINGF